MQKLKTSVKARINTGKNELLSIDCSPCGYFVVSANGERNNIMTFDLMKQKIIAQSAKLPSDTVASVRYSPRGKLIASGSWDRSIILWDAVTLTQYGKTLQGHQEQVKSLAFSPNSLYLIICNCQIQEQVGETIQTDYAIFSVEYSPDGLQILSAGDDVNIDIWNAQNGQHIRKLIGHKDWASQAIYSPDGRFIVSCSIDHSIKVWNVSTGLQIGNDLLGHDGHITSVAISPDCSIIVSGSWDYTVRIWNVSTLKQECSQFTQLEQFLQ